MCVGYSPPPRPVTPPTIPVFFNRIRDPQFQHNPDATRDKEEQAASRFGKRRLQIPLTSSNVESGLSIPRPSGR